MIASQAIKTGFASVGLVVLAATAFAVPVPYKNCGRRSDIVAVTMMSAAVWPPKGTPAPLQATAIYDPVTGELRTLTIDLLLGPEWVFQTGNLAAPLVGGFVALPSSIPLTLVSPALPIPAGPISNTQTLTSSNPGSQPITMNSNVNVKQSITSVDANLTLNYNGTPGFPVPPAAGTYSATVQASESGGQEIFCFDVSLSNLSFVETPTTSITLSSSTNPGFAGEAVTFTATVTSGSGTPTGDVSFYDGTALLGTAAVDASGQAALTTPLAAGTHNLTATYTGSGAFGGSTSTSSVLVQTMIVPTPALDERALLMLAVALAAIGALLLRRS